MERYNTEREREPESQRNRGRVSDAANSNEQEGVLQDKYNSPRATNLHEGEPNLFALGFPLLAAAAHGARERFRVLQLERRLDVIHPQRVRVLLLQKRRFARPRAFLCERRRLQGCAKREAPTT